MKRKYWEDGPLCVSENKKYLRAGETPFFWMGDTAWLLIQRSSREDADLYLKNRADKGYNVIQTDFVHTIPLIDHYGHHALEGDRDFTRPELSGEYTFWDHAEYVIGKAEELGLYMGILPVWGSMVKSEALNMNNVTAYAEFLGQRFQKYPNIIWIMGGDVRGDVHPEVWDAMAAILKRYNPERLMCYHPFGRTSSSQWFGDRDWLDIHMFQSGHRRYDQRDLKSWDDLSKADEWFGEDNWRYVLRDHRQERLRPTLDAEPSYEQIPQGLHDPKEGLWQDHDVRRYAWWSVLTGACGFTYGSNAVMQFLKPCYKANYGADCSWDEAIHHPGSGQVVLLKRLMERFPYWTGEPCQQMLEGYEGDKYLRVSAFAGQDFAIFYDYSGRPFDVRLGMLTGEKVNAWWMDPSSGAFSFAGCFENHGIHTFTPAKRVLGHNDAVLVLCDTGVEYIG